jgi:hypothetical protein
MSWDVLHHICHILDVTYCIHILHAHWRVSHMNLFASKSLGKRARNIYHTRTFLKNMLTNTLMPRTLFWLERIHGTSVAGDAHQTSMLSPLAFKHLSHHCTKACVRVWYKKSVPSVCRLEVIVWFLSGSVANCLPARCFVRGSKKWKSLGSILPTGLVTGFRTMANRLWTSLATVPILCAVISISLDALWRAWLANDLQQMLLWSKLSHPGYRHLAPIFLCWDTSLGTTMEHV